jgi:hypothetical protein
MEASMGDGTASPDQTFLEAVAQTVQTAPAMTTSSAEPARLEAYPDVLAAADEQLTALARDLDRDLGAFAAGAGAYLPAGFDPASDGNFVRDLRDESRYLADWVARIGAGFRAADTDPDGDGIFSANDGFLDGLVGPATVAEALTVPPAGTDPAEVAQWWATLPVNLRDRLIRSDYAQLGRLRGLPAGDTDRINRLRLASDRATLDARYDEVTDRIAEIDTQFTGGMGPNDRLLLAERARLLEEQDRLEVELSNVQKIEQQMRALDDDEPPGPHAYLLTYAHENEGRFAVALGNPDTADNTAVVVPGTGHDVKHETGLFPTVNDGRRLYDTMNAQTDTGATSNSVIVWMGADMPDEISVTSPNATNPTYGDIEHGAGWLRDDVAGYQAAHSQADRGDTPTSAQGHMTVITHSYGSYMTGEAIKGGMRVDDFVSVGSAGLRAERPEDLGGMDGAHVWAAAADADPVPDLQWHGNDPADADFGASVIDTSGSHGHSEYYEVDEQGRPGRSLRNLGSIAVGDYDHVVRRDPDPVPPDRLPNRDRRPR